MSPPCSTIHEQIPEAIVIVKTDGARKRWFKAPNQSEPVIPPWSQLCITVVNCEILGQPLTEALVHRPERVAELTGLHLGDPITPEAVGTVLTHPSPTLRKFPPVRDASSISAMYARPRISCKPVASRPALIAPGFMLWSQAIPPAAPYTSSHLA